MAYRIQLSPGAAKQFRKLDRPTKKRIGEKIDDLKEDPRPAGCTKLSGYDGLYRVRIGDFRIVYAIWDRLLLVLVLKIGSRSEVYDRIRKSDVDYLRQLLAQLSSDPP